MARGEAAAPRRGRTPMTGNDGLSRRVFLARLGIGFNAIVATLLGVPIVRYILSPITRERRPGYESWLSLGSLDQFPEGQTRFTTYRNPVVNAWDGESATIACCVRHLAGEKIQVFAINCAHPGCPVRSSPQSTFATCPCQGAACYAHCSRAPAPP